MKLQEVKCPNCNGSDVEPAGERLMRCRYCNTTFTIDYDEEDAAMDKSRIELQMQREKFEHQDKMQKEAKKSQRKSILIFLGILFAIIAGLIMAYTVVLQDQEESSSVVESKTKETIYVSDFSEIPDAQFEEMQSLALETAKKDIKIVTILGLTGDEPEFVTSYLLTSKEGDDNRLVFVYKDTWHKKSESIETYVFYYIQDLQLNTDGSVKYNAYVQDKNTMFMWNNNNIFGEESFDLCYIKAISANTDYNVIER